MEFQNCTKRANKMISMVCVGTNRKNVVFNVKFSISSDSSLSYYFFIDKGHETKNLQKSPFKPLRNYA